jgi:PIN domain nuclease of toxin-antitoxin system
MNYLLDTHTLLWFDHNRSKLSETAKNILKDPDNLLYMSPASVWEIQIKIQLGKLSIPLPLPDMIERQRADNNIEILFIALPHIYGLAQLPLHHRDPFDRLLLAQALVEDITLISADPNLNSYPVKIAW